MRRNSLKSLSAFYALGMFLLIHMGCVGSAAAVVPDPYTVTVTHHALTPSYNHPYPCLQMSGRAGVYEQILTPMVTGADLSHLPELYNGQVCIETTRATRAVLESGDLSGGVIGFWGSMRVNGVLVNWEGGVNMPTLVNKINAVSDLSGVTAAINGSFVRFSSIGYGSNAVINLTGMGIHEINPRYCWSVTAVGMDGIAIVTDSEGRDLTDALWSNSNGLVRDSLGNSITLAEVAGAVVEDMGAAIDVTMQQVDKVEWLNATTGTHGVCSGTNAWGIDGIALAPSQNLIEVTAYYHDGTTRSTSLSIDATPVESAVHIGEPVSDSVLVTHDPVVNIAGTADVPYPTGTKMTIIDPNIVASANLSHANLTQSTDVTIDVTTAATKVKYAGDVDLSGGLPSAKTVILNGVSIIIPAGSLASAVNAINGKTVKTGVTASDDGCRHLILTGAYGSAADIFISGSGASEVIGVAMKIAGVDAMATLWDADGNLVGGTWTGDGLTLSDDLGNHITLTERGNCVNTYSDEIHLDVRPKPHLKYTNWATGQAGDCDGLSSWTTPAISLAPGENLIQVRLTDDHSGDASDYITVKYYAPASTPGTAKKMSDGAYVSLADQVVTASGNETGTYIESADRSSGIRIVGADVPRGSVVSVDGVLDTINDERVLMVDSISVTGTGSLAPLGVTNAAITSNRGLDTAGLLLRTSGKVISIEETTNSVVIDDGSSDGLKCLLPASITINHDWKYVVLTGISSSANQRVIKVRDAADMCAIK